MRSEKWSILKGGKSHQETVKIIVKECVHKKARFAFEKSNE